LLNRDYRVPDKLSRSGQYWKAEQLTRSDRIKRLLDQYHAIKAELKANIR
jgi:hypothetical protein